MHLGIKGADIYTSRRGKEPLVNNHLMQESNPYNVVNGQKATEGEKVHSFDKALAPIGKAPLTTKVEQRDAQPECVDSILTYQHNNKEVQYLKELWIDAATKTVLGHLSVKSPSYKGI
jgi:hypothetical protein